MTVEEVLSSRMITEPLTLPMCSPIGDGAAALIVEGTTGLGARCRSTPAAACSRAGIQVGATGVLQVVELVAQLRGRAGERQVDLEPRLALAQNAGGFVEGDNAVAVITVLERER